MNDVCSHQAARGGADEELVHFVHLASGQGCSTCSLGFRAGRKGCRDTESGGQAAPRGDRSDPWTGEIAGQREDIQGISLEDDLFYAKKIFDARQGLH